MEGRGRDVKRGEDNQKPGGVAEQKRHHEGDTIKNTPLTMPADER